MIRRMSALLSPLTPSEGVSTDVFIASPGLPTPISISRPASTSRRSYPDRAAHVMSLIQQMRGGKDYNSTFGKRMRGEGPFAHLMQQRFAKAHARLGFGRLPPLDATRFTPPQAVSPQGQLF